MLITYEVSNGFQKDFEQNRNINIVEFLKCKAC
jgi:hypothetical protein